MQMNGKVAFVSNPQIVRQPVVYLARHATPDWNMRAIRYDVPPGPPLIAVGEEEATKLGAFLAGAGVHRVYCSPLLRALQTTAIVAKVIGTEVTVDEAAAEYRRDENDDAVFARFSPLFEQAWGEAQTEGSVAIVSHGGPVRVMLEKLGGTSDHLWHYRRQFDHQNPLPPAGAWEMTRTSEAGEWQMRLAFSPSACAMYVPQILYV